jgi:beta-phosphoglucomutase
MMLFKGAIFDFNGTLFWDTAFHDKAFDVFLEKHNIQLTDEEKRVKIHGKPNADIMRGIFGNHLTDADIYIMAQEKEAIYRELCINDLQFAPGAEDLFNFLKSNGVAMTIATSAGIENIDFYFEYMNLGQWFSKDKVAYDDGTFRGKPYPDVFLKAAEKLVLKPDETVMFEDSVPGIIAAEAAGAGKIYIVSSYGENYDRFSYDIINHFDKVNRKLFV